MIRIFKGVLVLRLWRSVKRQIELCIFPPFKRIPDHYHCDSNIELMHLWGNALYSRTSVGIHKSAKANLRHIGISYSIPCFSVHSAEIGWLGLITLSHQRWINERMPESVTKDYHEVPVTPNLI